MIPRETRPPRPYLDWRPPVLGGVEVKGSRLQLREWRLNDRDAVRAYAEDEEVVRYLVRGPAELMAEPELALGEAKRSPRTDFSLAIVLQATGAVIGSAEIYVESVRHDRAEIGYILRRDMWGHDLGTEVATLLLRLGFEDIGLHRLYATCDPRNAPSVRVLEKVGMRYEGQLRHAFLAHDGTWRDALLYAAVAEPVPSKA